MDIVTLALAKKYADSVATGGGGSNITIDATLTKEGQAADAKAVGDALNEKASEDYVTQQIGQLSFEDIGSDVSATAETLGSGTSATVSIEGNIFHFGIPKGDTGAQGVQGPKGDKGDTGDIGPQGPTGSTGPAATIQVGNVTSGTTASVSNSGTSSAAIFDFVLPKGDKGDIGPQGPAGQNGQDGAQGPQGPAGTNATITNVTAEVSNTTGTPTVEVELGGTESARTFNFSFSGLKGEQGVQGPPADTSELVPKSEKGAANGVATLNGSGKLAQMPSASDVGAVPTTRTVNGKALSSNISLTAADVEAVSQTVYQLTPQNGWEAASEASSCYLVVTGKLATLVARLKGINTTISSSSVIFTLPDGIVPQKYIDDVMACSGNFDSIRAIQIGTDGQVLAFSGSYTTGPYSINTSFLIN